MDRRETPSGRRAVFSELKRSQRLSPSVPLRAISFEVVGRRQTLQQALLGVEKSVLGTLPTRCFVDRGDRCCGRHVFMAGREHSLAFGNQQFAGLGHLRVADRHARGGIEKTTTRPSWPSTRRRCSTGPVSTNTAKRTAAARSIGRHTAVSAASHASRGGSRAKRRRLPRAQGKSAKPERNIAMNRMLVMVGPGQNAVGDIIR